MKKILLILLVLFSNINAWAYEKKIFKKDHGTIMDVAFKDDKIYYAYFKDELVENKVYKKLIIEILDKKFSPVIRYTSTKKEFNNIFEEDLVKIHLGKNNLYLIYNESVIVFDYQLKLIKEYKLDNFLKINEVNNNLAVLYPDKLLFLKKSEEINFDGFEAHDFYCNSSIKVVGKEKNPTLLNINKDGFINYKVSIDGNNFVRIFPFEKNHLIHLLTDDGEELLLYNDNDLLMRRIKFNHILNVLIQDEKLYIQDKNLLKVYSKDLNLVKKKSLDKNYNLYVIDKNIYLYKEKILKILDEKLNVLKTYKLSFDVKNIISDGKNIFLQSDNNFYVLSFKQSREIDYLLFLLFIAVLRMMFSIKKNKKGHYEDKKLCNYSTYRPRKKHSSR